MKWGRVVYKGLLLAVMAAAVIAVAVVWIRYISGETGAVSHRVNVLLDEIDRVEQRSARGGRGRARLTGWLGEFVNKRFSLQRPLQVRFENAQKIKEFGTNAIPALEVAVTADRCGGARLTALKCLSEFGVERSAAVFARALAEDSDEEVRKYAALMLRWSRQSSSVDALCDTLGNDAQDAIRLVCAISLGVTRSPSSLPALRKSLINDSSEMVRGSCASAIGYAGTTNDAVLLLETMSGDSAPSVRSAAAGAIGYLRAPVGYAPLLNTLNGDSNATVRASAATALGCFERTDSFDALVCVFREDTNVVAAAAVKAMARLDDDRVVLVINEALRDSRPLVCEAGVQAVGERGMTNAIPFLLDLFNQDPFAARCIHIVESLAYLVHEDARDTLESVLSNPRYRSSEELFNSPKLAALGLGYLGDSQSIPILVQTLENAASGHYPRTWHAHALAFIGDPSAAPGLRAALPCGHDTERIATARALAFCGDDSGFDLLVESLASCDEWKIFNAITGLAKLGTPSAYEALNSAKSNLCPEFQSLVERIVAGQGVRAFAPLLLGRNRIHRCRALRALQVFNDSAVRDELEMLTHSPDEYLRVQSKVALRRMDRLPPMGQRFFKTMRR